MAFDLGGSRVAVFGGGGGSTETDSAKQAATTGLAFFASTDQDHADGVEPLAYARIGLVAQGYLPGIVDDPNACQNDDGTIETNGCAPHDPSTQPWRFDADAAAADDNLFRAAREQSHTNWYWLGKEFRGFAAQPFAGNTPQIPTRADYDTIADGHVWHLMVFTLKQASDSLPDCPYWTTVGPQGVCANGHHVARLVASKQEPGGLFVVVYAKAMDGSGRALPATVRAQAQEALQLAATRPSEAG